MNYTAFITQYKNKDKKIKDAFEKHKCTITTGSCIGCDEIDTHVEAFKKLAKTNLKNDQHDFRKLFTVEQIEMIKNIVLMMKEEGIV